MINLPDGPEKIGKGQAEDKAQDSPASETTSFENTASKTPVIGDAQVATYLRRNPDFLVRYPDLLNTLQIPGRRDLNREGGNSPVVDLQQAMVEKLRDDVHELRSSRDELIMAGHSNLDTLNRVQEAILSMLSARSFEHLIRVVTNQLPEILDLEAIGICLEKADNIPDNDVIPGISLLPLGSTDALLGERNRFLLISNMEGSPEVYGERATQVQSQALARLMISPATSPAVLALGGAEKDTFSPDQGTELLSFLARALEHMIRAWLELTET